MSAKEKIEFSDDEKKLICGDKSHPSWQDIPIQQAIFHIKTFLQARGYFAPSFHESEHELLIEAGKKSKIKKVVVFNDVPKDFKIKRIRKVQNQILTPDRLNYLEGKILQQLKTNGYPCPKLNTYADPETGKVEVELFAGRQQDLVGIREEAVPGADRKILRRYDAFELGHKYNENLLLVTKMRTENLGVVESTYFVPDCKEEEDTALKKELFAEQKVFPGRPRLFQVGFGANTEEYALARVSWRHGRLGKNASPFQTSLYGSFKRQELNAQWDWYLLNAASRWYLQPKFNIKHEIESNYRLVSSDLAVTPAWSHDNQELSLKLFFGPQLTYSKAFTGTQQSLVRFLSGLVRLQIQSHDDELYVTDPQNGYLVSLETNFNHEKLLSDITVQRFLLNGHWLWNVGKYTPPFAVLGLRGGLWSSFLGLNKTNTEVLPPNYLYYLGGSSNLRGFSRAGVPNDDQGALSAAFLSFEARLADVLPIGIQPLVFFDAGMLGERSFRFSKPVYASPGFGIRLKSPIGVFRATAAKGILIANDDSNLDRLADWQFYLSFGEEF